MNVQNDDNDGSFFLTVLKGSIQHLPKAKINREEYLRSTLFPYCSAAIVEKAIEESPSKAGISKDLIEKLAKAAIARHRAGVSGTSFMMGLPGPVFLPATVPADMAQYYWHVIQIVQKLAYLHGWPSLINKNTEFDDETLHRLVIFIGVMFGTETAVDLLRQLAIRIAEQVVRKLPQQALTKFGFYVVAKEVAKWIGVQLTKDGFAKGIAKGIPLLGGLISGGITWFVFNKMSERLRSHLAELNLANE